MGVVKNQKSKTKEKTKEEVKKNEKKNVANGKSKRDDAKTKKDDAKVKKKKRVSCLQCFKSPDDGGLEGKYRVAAPELMQDTFMSDSEDEGGEVECPIQQQQQYRYMNSEAGTLHRARPLEDSVTDGHLWPSNNDSKVATIDRQPLDIGFLVSFVVDARGGAMKAKRRGGVRIIVPPAAASAPTRVTCRAATRRAPAAAPPPLMEGEALASRLLELQPQGAKFLAPVVIEVPIFTASCPEREIVILRSDTGDTWQDHYLHNNDNPMIQEALTRERQEFGTSGECLGESGERVTRIVTCDFPHYLAVVSRVRQEVHVIGPDGGTVSSAHIAQVQALFPPQALTKRIRVGLQAHGASPALCRRILPRHAAVSPVLTVEPRRRKFHRSITLTVPLPQNNEKGGGYDKSTSANLRLLCSIMGGQARAVWEDVTGSTPLTLTDDCASFTTTVSARFWLMNCQNVSDATKLATELYREMLLVPFEVRIVVLGKRLDALEGRLLVLYITDRYAYDTLLQQEHYTEVAHSTAVRFLDGKEVYLEFSGNLVPVTKSASQPNFIFEAFKDNRVEFTVRVKHHEETPAGRIYFMNDPKVGKGEQSQTPACVLDVQLPERIAPRAAKSHLDCLNLDQSGFDALKDELSFHWGDHNNSSGPGSLPRQHDKPQINGHAKTIANGDVKYTEKDKDEKETKPQVNGDSVHVDSNKTKATFDSDEDKTPMNTLEKGKKKPEGGSFLGGLADKVKNVFSHSEDKEDDVKESSPKPQPKPRETKDKSPPKPAPRIINEDLLDKVEDMFKDLHSKPHIKDDDDINSQVYSTKLIVDEEDKPHNLQKITEEVYHQYEHMQPVETPLHCKTTDPFQFYDGCCEGRYKKGEKHTHDETSNVTDRIEHVKFAAHEKLQDITERAENEAKDSLEKVAKEKDNIKQKSNEVIEELIEKSEKVVQDLQDKKESLKTDVVNKAQSAENAVGNKVDDLKKSAEKAKEEVHSATTDMKDTANEKLADAKSSAQEKLKDVAQTAEGAKEYAENKIQVLDFMAREKAEELKLRGEDKLADAKGALDNATGNLKDGAHEVQSEIKDGANAFATSLHNMQDDISNKASDFKTGVQNKVENVKDATNEKLQDMKDDLSKKSKDLKEATQNTVHDVQDGISNKVGVIKAGVEKNVDDVKEATNEKISEISESIEDVKGKAKKKTKEGKNFFTGLVHNIFGEKEKIENDVKDKVAEAKDAANDLAQQASATKDNIEKTVEKKHEELKEGAENLVQSVHDKQSEVVDAVSSKKDEVIGAVNKKSDEVRETIEDTKQGVEKKVESAKDEAKKAKDAVKFAAETELDRIRQEAEHTTDEIKRTAEEKLNAAANKEAEIVSGITNKCEEIKESGKEKLQEVQSAASDKVNDLQRSSKQAFDHAQNSTLSALDKVESSAKDAASDAQSTWEDLQSSTRDTFADLKDDAHGLESSAQDTLHSFQSSAGNTFDSLDDSVKEFASTTQGGVQSAGDNAKELFGDVKDTFEGFQLSAGNKLEDVKGATKQRLEETGDRLASAGENVKESVKESEAAVADTLATEADKFTSSLNDLGNSVFGSSGKGFMKDSSTKLLESEKAQSSPHKKGSGIPKLKRKK